MSLLKLILNLKNLILINIDMIDRETLFMCILYCNINMLAMIYFTYCSYYRIRLSNFFADLIFLGAGILSIDMYYKSINSHQYQGLLPYF
jgi:hypothetical protein